MQAEGEAEALLPHGREHHQQLDEAAHEHGEGTDDSHCLKRDRSPPLQPIQGGPPEGDEGEVPEDGHRGRQGEAVAQVQQARETCREAHQGQVGKHDAAQACGQFSLDLGATQGEQVRQGPHEQQHQGHAQQQEDQQGAQEACRHGLYSGLTFGGLGFRQRGQEGSGHGAFSSESAQQVGQAEGHGEGVRRRTRPQHMAEEEGLGPVP